MTERESHSRSRIIAAFAAVYIVWGSTYLAIRYAVTTMPPLLMASARFMLSGVVLYLWTRSRGAPRATKREWRDSAIAGTLMLCVGNGGVAWAEQRVPSGLAALIVAVVPLWMVLLDWLRPQGARPVPRVLIGVFIGLAGLVVLVGPRTIVGHGDVDATAAGVLMIASIAWAVGSIFSRHAARPPSAATLTGMQMMGGGIALLVAGALFGELHDLNIARVSTASWLGWAYLVTFGSLIGFTAYVYLLGAVSAAKAATYAYVNPVVAVILGWAVAGEAIAGRTIVAAAIIVAGVAMISLGSSSGH